MSSPMLLGASLVFAFIAGLESAVGLVEWDDGKERLRWFARAMASLAIAALAMGAAL